MQLQQKYQQALEKFVKDQITDPEVIGIFVTGSYALNKLKENSDLDVFIVTTGQTEQIIAKYYDAIEFECCYRPLKQYIYNLEVNPHDFDVQRFSTAIILYDTNEELEKIIDLAKKIYLRGPQRNISDADLYHLNDLFLDLKDGLNESYSKILMYKYLEKLLEIYFKKTNLWSSKEKYYLEYIGKVDPKFSRKLETFLKENDFKKQYQILVSLKDDVLSGVRALDKNW